MVSWIVFKITLLYLISYKYSWPLKTAVLFWSHEVKCLIITPCISNFTILTLWDNELKSWGVFYLYFFFYISSICYTKVVDHKRKKIYRFWSHGVTGQRHNKELVPLSKLSIQFCDTMIVYSYPINPPWELASNVIPISQKLHWKLKLFCYVHVQRNITKA